VILVDDVLTSGATSDACVKLLLNAGASSVRIACFARVLNEALRVTQSRQESETPEVWKTPGRHVTIMLRSALLELRPPSPNSNQDPIPHRLLGTTAHSHLPFQTCP